MYVCVFAKCFLLQEVIRLENGEFNWMRVLICTKDCMQLLNVSCILFINTFLTLTEMVVLSPFVFLISSSMHPCPRVLQNAFYSNK